MRTPRDFAQKRREFLDEQAQLDLRQKAAWEQVIDKQIDDGACHPDPFPIRVRDALIAEYTKNGWCIYASDDGAGDLAGPRRARPMKTLRVIIVDDRAVTLTAREGTWTVVREGGVVLGAFGPGRGGRTLVDPIGPHRALLLRIAEVAAKTRQTSAETIPAPSY